MFVPVGITVFCLLDSGRDGASTARQLDSQGSSSCIEYSAIRCGSAAVPAGAGTRQLNQHHAARGRHRPRETAGCCLTRTPVGRVRSRDRPGFKMKIKFDSAQSRPQSQVTSNSTVSRGRTNRTQCRLYTRSPTSRTVLPVPVRFVFPALPGVFLVFNRSLCYKLPEVDTHSHSHTIA